ncbi:hypothetical protein ABZ953_04065 [Streptomyces sp. NPDC046465]|uniref:hypothetical protein n=1 Tax=Streptomyces sp. NPDC046465 TaxID=3155810 RepID=UPI0033F48CB4
MRLRHTVGAALCALALAVAIPTSAGATPGNFFYKYGDPNHPSLGSIEEPKTNQCINIPEIKGKPETAFAPDNATPEAYAIVYTKEFCGGTKTKVPASTKLGPEVKFRSVQLESDFSTG